MSDIMAIKIPNFNALDPQLWFCMCDSTFELATPQPITQSQTKYNYCVAHLPPETASIVRDVIIKTGKVDPYQELKDAVIERCGESRTQEIRKLIAGEQLGDRKPSQLLRDMERRAEAHTVSDALLLELFLQQMPCNVQRIIASVVPTTAQKAAEIADRILEVSPPEVSELSRSSVNDNLELLAEIRRLRKEVASLRRTTSLARYRQPFRSRSASATREKNKTTMCWYHAKFKENAFKCIKPCSFTGNTEGQEI